jgi:hypothetical protein
VSELEGPIPILKISQRLVFTADHHADTGFREFRAEAAFWFSSCIFFSRQRTYCSTLVASGSSSPLSQKRNQSTDPPPRCHAYSGIGQNVLVRIQHQDVARLVRPHSFPGIQTSLSYYFCVHLDQLALEV